MKIEIWSDVICPFCYIGKRNFEKALTQFADKENIEVEWKSFQLDPHIPEGANESYEEYLVKRKGMTNRPGKPVYRHPCYPDTTLQPMEYLPLNRQRPENAIFCLSC